jgi:hypothetical protein
MNELNETAAKLETIKAQIEALVDEAGEILINEAPGDISYLSFETWIARIDTALTDRSEFCMSCDYTMDDAIRALQEWRKVA